MIDLIANLGFSCYQVDDYFCVTTPQTYASGKPVTYFFKQDANFIYINDFSLNFFAFSDCLTQPEKAQSIIAQLIKQTHTDNMVQFQHERLVCRAPKQHAETAIGHYINVLARLSSYTAKTPQEQYADDILFRIENYLYQRFDNANIIPNATIKGITGNKHKFNFQIGERFFDYLRPTARATGAYLRKLLDVKALNDDFQFQIILDDSNKDTFNRESKILINEVGIIPSSAMC